MRRRWPPRRPASAATRQKVSLRRRRRRSIRSSARMAMGCSYSANPDRRSRASDRRMVSGFRQSDAPDPIGLAAIARRGDLATSPAYTDIAVQRVPPDSRSWPASKVTILGCTRGLAGFRDRARVGFRRFDRAKRLARLARSDPNRVSAVRDFAPARPEQRRVARVPHARTPFAAGRAC